MRLPRFTKIQRCLKKNRDMKRSRTELHEDEDSSEEGITWVEDEPVLKQHKAGVPQGPCHMVPNYRLHAKGVINKAGPVSRLHPQLSKRLLWLPEETQVKIPQFILNALEESFERLILRTVLVENEAAQDLMKSIIKYLAVKKDHRQSKTSGLFGKNGNILFQHLHFVEEKPSYEDREAFVLRSKEHIKDFANRLEKEEEVTKVVLFIPISTESSLTLHQFLLTTLQTLDQTVILFYLAQEASVMSSLLSTQLTSDSVTQQLNLMKMTWDSGLASTMASQLLSSKISLGVSFKENLVIPPLTPFYLYLFFRHEWQRSILCRPRFAQARIRFCETALQAFVVQALKSRQDIMNMNQEAHIAILQNLEAHEKPLAEPPVVALHLSEEHTLTLSVDGHMCPRAIMDYCIPVTPEMEAQLDREMELLRDTSSQIQVAQKPPGSMALHASMMLPLFEQKDTAREALFSHVRDFCYQASPGTVVVYENQMLIDPSTNRQQNLWMETCMTNPNILYAIRQLEKIPSIETKQIEIQEKVQKMELELKELKSQKKIYRQKKREVGSIYKFKQYWKIQYRDQNNEWKSTYLTRYITTPEGKEVLRPLNELYQRAQQVGLSKGVIQKSIRKMKNQGQLAT